MAMEKSTMRFVTPPSLMKAPASMKEKARPLKEGIHAGEHALHNDNQRHIQNAVKAHNGR